MTAVVFSYQVIDGRRYKAMSAINDLTTQTLKAPRGVAYDLNGQQVISNLSTYAVYIEPQVFKNFDLKKQTNVLDALSKILNIDVNDIKNILQKYNNQEEALIKSNISYDLIGTKIISDPNNFAGIEIKKDILRQYSYSDVMSHILGYTGLPTDVEVKQNHLLTDDSIGKTGIEATYDNLLRGKNGTSATTSSNETITTQDAQTGTSLGLTIDVNLQKQIKESLLKAIKESGATGGVGVVEDVTNGDILGMVSLPSYDDNMFARGITYDEFNKLYTDPFQPTFDRTLQGGYTPGSTFKTITGAAALLNNAINTQTTFSTGVFDYKGTKFYDYAKHNYGTLDIVNAYCKSSNIFFMKSADALDNITNGDGINLIDTIATKFGIGQKTGIDLPAETSGVLSSIKYTNDVRKQQWLPGYLMNTVIGQQDTLVSPIQMVNLAAAIANNGTLYKPRVVNRTIDSQTNATQVISPKVITNNIANLHVIDIVKQGMRCSATRGVAAAVNSSLVEVAAKTGTAEIGIKDNTGEYSASQAWVMGFFPYEHPKYSFAFLLEKGGLSSGAAISAKSVIDWLAKNYSDKLK